MQFEWSALCIMTINTVPNLFPLWKLIPKYSSLQYHIGFIKYLHKILYSHVYQIYNYILLAYIDYQLRTVYKHSHFFHFTLSF